MGVVVGTPKEGETYRRPTLLATRAIIMRSFTAVFLLVGTCYAAVTLAISDLDFLNEESSLFLQDQLDHYAKVDPSGLEALKNGIEEALVKNTFPRGTRSEQVMTKMRRGTKKQFGRGRNMNTHNIFRLDKRNMNTHNIFRLDK